MGTCKSKPAEDPDPWGVLYLGAAAEVSLLLERSARPHHLQLCRWLRDQYIPDELRSVFLGGRLRLDHAEPRGCHIRSTEDLDSLSATYKNAKVLKVQTSGLAMEHELHIHGQEPGPSAKKELEKMVQKRYLKHQSLERPATPAPVQSGPV
jgi:hypothetical protein